MKIVEGSIFFLLLLNMMGCTYHLAVYHVGLSEVERPIDAKDRYGEQQIIRFKDQGKTKYRFEDEMVEIIWGVMPTQIAFELRNKTTHSIKIIWDETVYVDELGESKRVMHSGVKYSEKNNSQPPTVIPRGTTVTDMIVPVDNVSYGSGSGWKEKPLLPNQTLSAGSPISVDVFESIVKEYVGKTIQVLLSLKIEDVVNEYIFSFVVNDVEIRKVTP